MAFLKDEANKGRWDVIVVDSSDPVGPAAGLFELPFFSYLRQALRPGGIAATQAECVWLDLAQQQRVMNACRKLFKHVELATCQVPSYPMGHIGCMVLSDRDAAPSSAAGVRTKPFSDDALASLKYYDPEAHNAYFASVPLFAKRALAPGAAPLTKADCDALYQEFD